MRHWVVGSMGRWVRGWSSVFVAMGDVFRTVLDPWYFHRSLSTSTTAVRHLLYCCNTWWVDRFVGVTVVLRSAVLL